MRKSKGKSLLLFQCYGDVSAVSDRALSSEYLMQTSLQAAHSRLKDSSEHKDLISP